MTQHLMHYPVSMQAAAISAPIRRHSGIDALQIDRAKPLNRHRSDTCTDVLAKQLLVTCEGFVRDVLRCPIAQPALSELIQTFSTWIDMQSVSHGSEDSRCFLLRLLLGPVQRDVTGLAPLASGGRKVVLKSP